MGPNIAQLNGAMGRPKRLEGFSYVGRYRYFLTTCTLDRQRAFEAQAVATSTIDQFLTTARFEQFAVPAYCLMPDHLHMLVEGRADEADFQRFVKLAKQRSGAAYALKSKRRLWQKSYYERVLREHEDSKDVARYIVANPVRAGLVQSATEYPYLGSDEWSLSDLIDSIID